MIPKSLLLCTILVLMTGIHSMCENSRGNLPTFTADLAVTPEEKAEQGPDFPIIRILGYDYIPFRKRDEILAYSLEGDPLAPRDSKIVQVLLPEYRIQFSHLSTGDIVALLGGLYRVKSPYLKGGTMEWIAKEDRPVGIFPKTGSMFLPLQKGGAGGIILKQGLDPIASLKFLGHYESLDKKTIHAKMISCNGDVGFTPNTVEYLIKTGDVLLVRCSVYDNVKRSWHAEHRGYKVRAIVPANEKTRVRGWVEFDANGIPEADLIRDKVAFIRPVPLKKKSK